METELPKKTKRELVMALKHAEINHGPDHLNTAYALENLAKYLSAQHLEKPQHPDAEPLCRRMVEIIKKNYGEDSIQYSNAALVHSEMLVHSGCIVEAIPLVFKSWQVSIKFLGSRHDSTDLKRFMFLQYLEEAASSGIQISFNFDKKPTN